MQARCAEDRLAHTAATAGQNPPSHTTIEVIAYGPDADVNGFDALANEWNELLVRSCSNTIFLTYEWQTNWWRCLGKGNCGSWLFERKRIRAWSVLRLSFWWTRLLQTLLDGVISI